MTPKLKTVAYVGGGVVGVYVLWRIAHGITSRTSPLASVRNDVSSAARTAGAAVGAVANAPVTAVSGGALARWTARHGQPPTNMVSSGSLTRWPIDARGTPGTVASRDMRGFVDMAVANGIPFSGARAYAALAALEGGTTARAVFHFNAWGIHWTRGMEPLPAFLSTDAGVPTMFAAYRSWPESLREFDRLLQTRYPQARAAAFRGDMLAFAAELGRGGYGGVYRRNPRYLGDVLATMDRNNRIQRTAASGV